MKENDTQSRHHVVIIGGGFGGLYAAKSLRRAPVRVTLLDKRNFHLFQPLLYQVATGGLSPGDIASPLRAVLKKAKNIQVLEAEAIDIDPHDKKVILRDGELEYDSLIVATGVSHHYFGNEAWHKQAPGLKTVEDALDIRRRILLAFETAERETNPDKQRACLNFVIVGGGPTGVELAGALGELANGTLKDDFRNIDPRQAQIMLLEGADRILPTFPPNLSVKAEQSLQKLGVTVRTQTLLTQVGDNAVTVRHVADGIETDIPTLTVLWAAGIKASSMGGVLAARAEASLDRAGRVIAEPDLTVPDFPELFVIGDLAHFAHQEGEPLSGVAQVAMQQGKHVAVLIQKRLRGESSSAFVYKDKGNLAVIGRNAAVAQIGSLHVSGFFAWFVWAFIHISYLIEFDNKLLVLLQWAGNYFTRKRGARLITGDDPFPMV